MMASRLRPRGTHRRIRTTAVSTVVLGLLVAACATVQGPASSNNDAQEEQRPTVVVTRTRIFSDSTIAIATANGWFEEAGLDVRVLEGQASTDVLPLLVSGEADVAYAGFSPIIARAIAEGSGVRAVAVGSTSDVTGCADYALVALPAVHDRLDLTDADAVRRLRFGGPFGSGFVGLWAMDTFARGLGMTLGDLQLREVTTAQAAATLAGGGVDLQFAAEPALTRLREELDAQVVLRVSDLIPGLARTAVFFGPRILADPELAASYLAIHLRALDQHARGPTEENIAALTGPTGLEPELLRAMCWTRMRGLTRPYESVVTEAFAFAQSQGLLEVAPTSEQLWDHTVGDRARALLETSGIEVDD